MLKRYLITIVLSILIIALMLWYSDPSEFASSIRKVNFEYILLVIVLYIGNIFTKGLRWFLLIGSTGADVRYKKVLPIYIIGLAFNNVTPGKIGGEPIRAYLLKKESNVPIGAGVASILTEKIMDVIVITIMAVVGIFFILPLLLYADSLILILILSTVIIGTSIVILLLTNQRLLTKVIGFLVNAGQKRYGNGRLKHWMQAFSGFFERFRESIKVIFKSRRIAVLCIGLTLLIWINEAIRLYIILLAMPDVPSISLGAVFIATSIANILGLVLPLGSANIFGIGTVFIAVGMDSTDASMGGFLHAATSIWISIPLGVIIMLIKGIRPSKISK